MTGEVSKRLPKVDQEATIPPAISDDLFDVAFDPNDDDKYRSRWLQFKEEQPAVTQELHDSISFLVTDIETRKQVMDQISLAYAAISKAVKRRYKNPDSDLESVA